MSLPIERYLPGAGRLVYGCMGLGGEWDREAIGAEHLEQAHACIDAALEGGIKLFDHADIYTLGKAEQVFGKVLKQRPALREQIYLQSKCGIRFARDGVPKRYDLSPDWIVQSVEGSLQRLGTDYLDLLLLHRPDPLMVPEAIADTFDQLHAQGKVRQFGVSNMHAHQLELLASACRQPVVVNQLEISLQQRQWLEEGVLAGHPDAAQVSFSPGTFEYCRRRGVQLQAWGSLCQGIYSGRGLHGQPGAVHATAARVAELSRRYGVTREAIVLAWLLRHPAGIQPLIGTAKPARIRACAAAKSVPLSADDWYSLYVSARGEALP